MNVMLLHAARDAAASSLSLAISPKPTSIQSEKVFLARYTKLGCRSFAEERGVEAPCPKGSCLLGTLLVEYASISRKYTASDS